MALFDIREVWELIEGDELELEKIDDRKTALLCIISDTDMTFNFISAMAYTQMFNVLCGRALQNGGALSIHVTYLLDEFANQKTPNFHHLISVICSREISAHIVVQTQSQLKAVYSTFDARGSQHSMGVNYQKLGKNILYYLVNSSVTHKNTRTGTRLTELLIGD